MQTSCLFYKHGRGVELGSTVKQLQLVVRTGLETQDLRILSRRSDHSTSLPSGSERERETML